MLNTAYGSLQGKHVLITGGASGIGESLVEGFVAQGCTVSFLDIQTDAGQKLAQTQGDSAHFYHCDLTNINTIRSVTEELIDAHGPVAVLVNNAANDQRQALHETEVDDWDWSQHVNLRSQFFVAQAVFPSMQHLPTASIINLSSISWRIGVEDLTAYSTAKAGILGLTNSLAKEFGQQGIRVNAVEPGAIMTEKQRKLWYPTEADVAKMTERQLTPNVLVSDDVVALVLFLASDDSAGITGQSIRVDGGYR